MRSLRLIYPVVMEGEYARGYYRYRCNCVRSAEQGDAEAQYNLGICYYNGRGVKKDTAEAVKCFRKAAKNGNSEAKAMLDVLDSPVPQP